MNLPDFGVRRPVTNLMIFAGIILLSLFALSRLGVDMMPEIEPPAISVIAVYPGASPEDVEIKVTEPLENQLATTPGLEKITSRSLEGVAVITLKFTWGINLDEASNDIRDRIEMAKRVLPDIPDEMDNPFIFKFNTAMIPILFVGITAERSYPELYDMIDKRIGDALRQLPGVGTVQLHGGLKRQINIWVDKRKLEGAGFSILDIQNVLARENITQPVGNLKTGLSDYLLRLPGEFASPEEINSVILGQRQGKLVYLKDVARVEDGFQEVTTIVRVNGKSAVQMMIQKQIGANTVEVAQRVKQKLKALEPTLPSDVNFLVVMDTSKDILDALSSLKSTVWNGGLLVILVTWFFLRRFRSSMIIALTIPFSLLIAFIYLFLAGKTINVISLSSLTIAIGMVVDNAIVVADNITRHLDRGERPMEASIFGASEMFPAIAASTATTIVVFMPLLFVSGVVGIMFGELAVIVCVTLIASLFTAATFTPMLCSRWLRRTPRAITGARVTAMPAISRFRKIYDLSERWFAAWEQGYGYSLAWCLDHRKTIIFGFTALFLGSLLLIKFVGNEFIPEEDSGDLNVTVHLPIGTRVEETDRVAHTIEVIFNEMIPEKISMRVRSGATAGMGAIFGGQSGTHVISGGVKLAPKDQRRRSIQEIAQAVRQRIKAVPGVVKTDLSTANPLGRVITGTGGKSVQVEIIGNSFADTDAVAEKIKAVMERTPGAVDVSISREMKRPELRLAVDREKASALGLDMYTLSQSVRAFMDGATASKYREKGETYDIYVRLEETDRSRIKDIESLMPVSPYTGQALYLGNLARIIETVGPVEVERQNRERVVRVECNTHGRSMGKVIEDIRGKMAGIILPADVAIVIGGEAEEQGKAFKDLTLLLLLGIALVYMVMAAQFESLLDPFIVMFAVPFTFTGVILAFLLTGTTLSVITFLGIVMLMGIVVNNAIVLISYINILRARGLTMLEAVTIGGRDRLRPVLMTTLTTLMGLLPLALSRGEGSETWQPLGITMIGGLTVSTFITLLFVPTLYAVFESNLKRFRKINPATGPETINAH
ncbi:MAG: efflux RND transporter permease subunit [Verrucomicrobiota bacterium]